MTIKNRLDIQCLFHVWVISPSYHFRITSYCIDLGRFFIAAPLAMGIKIRKHECCYIRIENYLLK